MSSINIDFFLECIEEILDLFDISRSTSQVTGTYLNNTEITNVHNSQPPQQPSSKEENDNNLKKGKGFGTPDFTTTHHSYSVPFQSIAQQIEPDETPRRLPDDDTDDEMEDGQIIDDDNSNTNNDNNTRTNNTSNSNNSDKL